MPRIVTLMALLLVLYPACQSGPGSDVAASVNGYKITYAELEKYYQSQVLEMDEPPSENQRAMLRLSMLREVIDRQIMLQKAEQLGLIAVDSEIDAKLNEYRAPYDSAEEFAQDLAGRGMTVSDLRAEIRRDLSIEKLFNREVAARISVAEAELRDYYEANQASFHLPEQQMHLAQILVTARPETPVPNLRNNDAEELETAQSKIEMLHSRLEQGDDFATLAQGFSEDPVSAPNGGDLGFIKPSFLEKADIVLRRVVASLSPGEISPVVKTGDEFRILKLISIEAAGPRDFSDPRVQQTIRDNLTRQKDQLLKTAFLESVRNEAQVENYYAERIVSELGPSD